MHEAAGRLSLAIGVVDREAAGHAEMHDENLAIVEPRQEIFRAPVESLDRPSLEPLGEVLRQRKAQVFPALLDARERIADQDRLKALPHGFDLWKLRHGIYRSAKETVCAATIA
jgi:hypothetical protein